MATPRNDSNPLKRKLEEICDLTSTSTQFNINSVQGTWEITNLGSQLKYTANSFILKSDDLFFKGAKFNLYFSLEYPSIEIKTILQTTQEEYNMGEKATFEIELYVNKCILRKFVKSIMWNKHYDDEKKIFIHSTNFQRVCSSQTFLNYLLENNNVKILITYDFALCKIPPINLNISDNDNFIPAINTPIENDEIKLNSTIPSPVPLNEQLYDQKEETGDIILKFSQTEHIKAHRAVLICQCKYFESLLRFKAMTQKGKINVLSMSKIPSFHKHTFELFIRFLYLNKIKPLQEFDDLKRIWEYASFFGVDSLGHYLVKVFLSISKPENIIQHSIVIKNTNPIWTKPIFKKFAEILATQENEHAAFEKVTTICDMMDDFEEKK